LSLRYFYLKLDSLLYCTAILLENIRTKSFLCLCIICIRKKAQFFLNEWESISIIKSTNLWYFLFQEIGPMHNAKKGNCDDWLRGDRPNLFSHCISNSFGLSMMVHFCNPSYSGGGGRGCKASPGFRCFKNKIQAKVCRPSSSE
jgi:hypothetical protein